MMLISLERFAALTLGVDHGFTELPPITLDTVTVRFSTIPNIKHKFLMIAQTHFESERVTGAWDPQVDVARRRAEAAIRSAGDIIAVATGLGRAIEGVSPCFYIAWPKGSSFDAGDDWTIKHIVPRTVIRGSLVVPAELVADLLVDRRSGLELMSLALSNSNELGRYLALCRVFENAFRISASDRNSLSKRLMKFLAGADLGYSRSEIAAWLDHRNAAAHADRKKAGRTALDNDVSTFLQRMEQAAFDVLLNKLTWHDRSAERRDTWTPNSSVGPKPTELHGAVGLEFDRLIGFLDPFSEWPLANDCKAGVRGEVRYPRLEANIHMQATTKVVRVQS